jgi:hypothetical protein
MPLSYNRFVRFSWLLGSIVAACSGGNPPVRPAPSHEPPPPTPTAVASDTPDAAPAPAPSVPAKNAPFALPDITPPFARTAQEGDGKWQPVPEVGAVDGSPLALRTNIRPHGIRKDVYVALIAFDLERVALEWVAGTQEPETKSVPANLRRGLVPTEDRDSLLAAFNGGFMAKHGKFGAMLEGSVFLPPRDGACTIAIDKNGKVRVANWETLAPSVADMKAYRQTPPCFFDEKGDHPLLGKDDKKWGLSAEGKMEIRRSALGVDRSGRALVFGLGEWVLPKNMGSAMKLAGVTAAAELDINWSFTRFNFYGRPSPKAPVEVTGTLIPQLVHTKKSYVAEIAPRDFFYVKKRP